MIYETLWPGNKYTWTTVSLVTGMCEGYVPRWFATVFFNLDRSFSHLKDKFPLQVDNVGTLCSGAHTLSLDVSWCMEFYVQSRPHTCRLIMLMASYTLKFLYLKPLFEISAQHATAYIFSQPCPSCPGVTVPLPFIMFANDSIEIELGKK